MKQLESEMLVQSLQMITVFHCKTCKRCNVLYAVISVVSDRSDSLVSHAFMLHKATNETAVHARTYLINLDKLKSKKNLCRCAL